MSFDRLAKHYGWMERLVAGGKLQRARMAFLDEAKEAKAILLVGEGHGRFLPELLRANREGVIACVDASGAMLEVARDRLDRSALDAKRVTFHHSAIQDFSAPPEAFDLVVTHFFLDCFAPAELARVVAKIAALLRPGGKWVLADFQIPRNGWRNVRAKIVLALAYAFFRRTVRLSASDLVDPKACLRANGLSCRGRLCFNFELIYAECWQKG